MKTIITGDTHGKFSIINKLINKKQPDVVVVCGDFGYFNKTTLIQDSVYGGYYEVFTDYPFDVNDIKNQNTKVYWVPGNHECVFPGTDILTNNGFKKIIDLLPEDLVAQFNQQTKKINFEKPLQYVKKKTKNLLLFESAHSSQLVTKKHNIFINNKLQKAENFINETDVFQSSLVTSGIQENEEYNISDNLLRLLVWSVCDATLINYQKYDGLKSTKRVIQFKLSKQRKIDRLINILNEENYNYTFTKTKKSITNKLQPYYIKIFSDLARLIFNLLNDKKQFPHFFRLLSVRQKQIIIEEIIHTDGYKFNNQIGFVTTNKFDADLIQEICLTSGKVSTISKRSQSENAFGKKDIYYVYILDKATKFKSKIKIKEIEYDGDVYCLKMPLGTLITRYNGKIAFTGNCWDNLEKEYGRRGLKPIPMKGNENIFYCPIGSSEIINGERFLFVGGADSIDKQHRTIGVDWFPQETLNHEDWEYIIEQHKNTKIDTIISHTCPSSFEMRDTFNMKHVDFSRKVLEELLQEFKPIQWYFGHWHVYKKQQYKNTMWTCLDHNKGKEV